MPDSKGELARYRERFEREFDPPDDWRVMVYWLDRYYVWLESALSTAEQRRDEEWKRALNHQEFCNGSDEIENLSVEGTTALMWKHINNVFDASAKILRNKVATAEQRIEELEKELNSYCTRTAVTHNKLHKEIFDLNTRLAELSKAEATIAELRKELEGYERGLWSAEATIKDLRAEREKELEIAFDRGAGWGNEPIPKMNTRTQELKRLAAFLAQKEGK